MPPETGIGSRNIGGFGNCIAAFCTQFVAVCIKIVVYTGEKVIVFAIFQANEAGIERGFGFGNLRIDGSTGLIRGGASVNRSFEFGPNRFHVLYGCSGVATNIVSNRIGVEVGIVVE
ncbi:hypothetical protein IMSAGC014_01437 [Bacteroidaceae bacterium]|nr:hypothetical protein IMSAGC014_01437 [Bacteroidaceae bacterium]